METKFSIPYHTLPYKVDREAFEKVAKDVDAGIPLNATMLGAIFGTPFWQLLIMCQTRLEFNELDPKQVTIVIETNG